jgi:hypothetical protein
MEERKIKTPNGIFWSGGDVEMMPIIGFITTKEVTIGMGIKIPSERIPIVEITSDGDIYIKNAWYKEGVPQVIHSSLVDKFELTENYNK